MLNRRQFLQYASTTAALSVLPSFATDLTLWGPPVAPTVLLAIAAEMGEARKIRPFSVQSWKTPDQLRAGLLNKTIVASIVPCYVAANLRAQGQPVQLHNIMTTGLLNIISKQKITSFQQLENQKLVLPFKGDMPDLVLKILAQKLGVQLGEMTYTATPPEAVMMFLQKDFPHTLLPEPLSSAAILRGKQLGVEVEYSLKLHEVYNEAFGSKVGLIQAGLMFTEEFIATHTDFIRALDMDLLNAVEWVKNNAHSAAEIASNYMPAPVPALERSFPNSSLTALRTKEISKEILDFLNLLHELNSKIVGGKLPDESLFDA